jgi:hypothetical protein
MPIRRTLASQHISLHIPDHTANYIHHRPAMLPARRNCAMNQSKSKTLNFDRKSTVRAIPTLINRLSVHKTARKSRPEACEFMNV